MAVRFLARWTCLFRRKSLWHCAACRIRNALSRGERRLLGGAFNRDVTMFVGSARWGGSPINIAGPPDCYFFHLPPLLSPLLSCLLLLF